MANREHLYILLQQGVNDGMSGATRTRRLSHRISAGLTLYGVNLRGANFSRTNVSGVYLWRIEV
ncbi:MAG TPA: pentapeptide repeat-containing protein [Bryobacteraceae bacterium]|nr:pentapeptide repeat-containing protein [Bryobacteraceae bacterium]